MHRHGFYLRFVILSDGCCKRFGVYRFRCSRCRHTVSVLPDFCVPYKHFCADVIGVALCAVLLVGRSVYAVAHRDNTADNKAGFTRFCVGQWVDHFARNCQNLWQFGLARLGVALGAGSRSEPALLGHLLDFGVIRVGCADQALRAVQCALSRPYPPYGLFRAHLVPGCCT